ncbi:MFS transporter [Neorhizobium sp. NPDC001467]|uniref:MFS transporter n=1 Tax=Neorhizobium sp. NPDC001467 TaxID=3390595 RepID=UPI003CFCF8E1
MPQAPHPRNHSRMMVYSFFGAALISATSSAPTPLYGVYQTLFHLSPGMVTLIFGAYAFALLVALLIFGSLSDYLGRKPLILMAFALNALALCLFILAQSAGMLFAARIVQGLATGIAFPTFGATLLDCDKTRGPLLNSITAFIGLMIGTLAGGVLAAFAPFPTQLVYVLLLAFTLTAMLALAGMPETASLRYGALAALKPNVAVPLGARASLLRLSPVNIAGWSLGGFYLSLMPSLVSAVTGIRSPFVGAAVVATLMLSATLSVLGLRSMAPRLALKIGTGSLIAGVTVTLFGIGAQAVALLFLGTAIAGLGFGSNFANVLKLVLPLAQGHERAGLFAAFLVQSYLAFSLPAILAGLAAPWAGLPNTAFAYGAGIMTLALVSLAATRSRHVGAQSGL